MQKFISKLLLRLEPVMKWIDHTFTIPFSKKNVTGDHYYLWRNDIHAGHVFLSQVFGVGSNLINPSEINHSAIYFGRGLRSAMLTRMEHLNASSNSSDHAKAIRIEKTLVKFNVQDEICYVIEAIGKGVVPTNLVKFLTTKDIIKILKPKFTDDVGMRVASVRAIDDLGLPYDYAFTDRNDAKYCFEVSANAYESTVPGLQLNKKEYRFLGIKLYDSFLADTFLDKTNWECIIDSELYL